MYKAGQVERVILRKLSEADPEGKRHVIRMLGSFEYRHHLCLVFEAMVSLRRQHRLGMVLGGKGDAGGVGLGGEGLGSRPKLACLVGASAMGNGWLVTPVSDSLACRCTHRYPATLPTHQPTHHRT